MDFLIRRRALCAAARVALSVPLIGCGGIVRVDEARPDQGSDTPAPTSYGGAAGAFAAGGNTGASQNDAAASYGKGDPPMVGDAEAGRPDFDVNDHEADVLAEAAAAVDAGLMCGVVAEIDAAVGQGTFQCCVDLFKELTHDGGTPLVLGDASSSGDSMNCCRAIVADIDGRWQDYNLVPYTVLNACCSALGYPINGACTPWGPPMPPRMTARVDEIWEVS